MFFLPPSSISELSGPAGCGKTELTLRFLAQEFAAKPHSRIAWINEASHACGVPHQESATTYPRAFSAHGIPLSQTLFVSTKSVETSTVIQQLLASQSFAAIVISASIFQAVDLRRIQIGAKRACARVILLTHSPTPEGSRWMIARQVSVRRIGEIPLSEIRTDTLKDGKLPIHMVVNT